MGLVYALFVGIAMGALLQRVGASSPTMILRSLRLEDLTVIKFMATTIAVGSVAAYALATRLPMHFDIKPTYLVGVTLGGLVFGVGFALAGYCPGTCVVGLAEGRKDAVVTVVGGVVGALAFTVAYPMLEDALIKPLAMGSITLASVLHSRPLVVACILAAAILATIAWLPTRRQLGASAHSR